MDLLFHWLVSYALCLPFTIFFRNQIWFAFLLITFVGIGKELIDPVFSFVDLFANYLGFLFALTIGEQLEREKRLKKTKRLCKKIKLQNKNLLPKTSRT